MKMYVDENVPQKIVSRIRSEGYVVEYVTRSMPDQEILACAFKENALLITSDKDFERLVLDGNRLLVIASNIGAPTHPAWYRNLIAHPEVTVELFSETYRASAVALTGSEREQTWARIVELYPFFAEHQAKTSRQIPVVALERQ